MAIIYVDSAASGANDGTSWTDAYTSLGSATGKAGGDVVYVEKDHAETSAVAWNFNSSSAFDRPLVIIGGIDSTDDSYTERDWSTDTVPSITTTGTGGVGGRVIFINIRFVSAADFKVWDYDDTNVQFYNCMIDMSGGTGRELQIGNNSATIYTEWHGCTIKNAAQSQEGVTFGGDHSLFMGCTFLGACTQGFESFSGERSGRAVFRGCDISAYTTDLYTPGQRTLYKILFDSCILGTGITYVSSLPENSSEITLRNCHIGTISDPPFIAAHITNYGAMGAISSLSTFAVDATAMSATYRTGGATDGVRSNPYSWPMIAAANRTTEGYCGLESLPLTAWVAGNGSTTFTVTVYFAHGGIGDGTGGALQNDQIWMDVYSGNDAAANSLAILTSTKPAPLATPSDVTTDGTSSWSGASVGTKQKLTATITPDLQGPITVIVTFAPGDASDTTVYIDPKLDIS